MVDVAVTVAKLVQQSTQQSSEEKAAKLTGTQFDQLHLPCTAWRMFIITELCCKHVNCLDKAIDANVVAVENLTDSLTKMMDVRNLSSDVFVNGNQANILIQDLSHENVPLSRDFDKRFLHHTLSLTTNIDDRDRM